MKNILLFALMLTSVSAFSASDKYEEMMKKTVAQMDTTSAPTNFQQLANSFERIATVEKTEWLPWYYSAYCTVMASYSANNKKKTDEWMDAAQVRIDKADSIKPNNSEIYCVKSMIYSARIMVNPMSRGKKFGTLSGEMTKRAMELDSTNPRPYFLQGTGLYYTPKMFGGGKDKALPVLETAIQKYKIFKPETEIAPHWGREQATTMLIECRNSEK